jgi:hypothetical protein
MFNKVFKVALDVVLTKRIKDGAELYSLLTGMPPRVITEMFNLVACWRG